MALPIEKERYTFADMLTWDDGKRVEIIDREVFMMAPAPSREHQGISVELTRQFANYLEGKNAKLTTHPLMSASLRRMGIPRRMWTRWWSLILW